MTTGTQRQVVAPAPRTGGAAAIRTGGFPPIRDDAAQKVKPHPPNTAPPALGPASRTSSAVAPTVAPTPPCQTAFAIRRDANKTAATAASATSYANANASSRTSAAATAATANAHATPMDVCSPPAAHATPQQQQQQLQQQRRRRPQPPVGPASAVAAGSAATAPMASCPTTRAGRPFVSRRTSAPLGRYGLLKLLLSAFYAEHNNSLVARTEAILAKWHDREERLFERLERKYGIHPLEYWPEMAPRLAATDTSKERLAVVLDLDETLIHSILEDDEEGTWGRGSPEQKGPGGIDSFRIHVDGETFTVNKRPGLHDFLRKASQLYDLYIYTAGARDYAEAVVRNIDPSGQFFRGLFFRADCVQVERDFLKDITICDRARPHLRRTVLVDNNPVSFTMQPANGISIRDFYDDPQDEELPVLLHLLRAISKFKDVRVALKKAQSNPLIADATRQEQEQPQEQPQGEEQEQPQMVYPEQQWQ